MDSFSRSDRIRAVCAPLCCCFSRRLALSPSTESLNPDSPNLRDWYANSRPSAQSGASSGMPRSWGEYEARDARREADLLSLHEGVGTGDLSSTRRRRVARTRGGDISGGGADEGSGLTRWTLFKSWWKGGGGDIRLEDSDDEQGEVDAPDGALQAVQNGFDEHGGEENAIPLAFEDVAVPPAPPSNAARPPPLALAPPDGPPATAALPSPTVSESAASSGAGEDRQARRARRHARRRARELGISLEEFEAGVAADPAELPTSPFLDVHVPVRRGSKSERSLASSASSGSRSRRHEAAEAALFAIGEEGDGADDSAGLREPKHKSRRSRRDDGARSSHRSADSGSHEGSSRHRRHAGAALSSTGSRDQEHAAASLVPLPLSPRPDSHGPSSSHGSSSRPSRHRSHPSTSTISTEASSRASRRSKRRDRVAEEAHLSPLHDPAGGDDGVEYFEDEHGQLHAYYAEQGYADDGGEAAQVQVDYAAALSPSIASWDHIGVLPGAEKASAPADIVAEAGEQEQEEEEEADGW